MLKFKLYYRLLQWALTAGLFYSAAVLAADDTVKLTRAELAQQYMAYLTSADYAKIGAYLNERSNFEDRTANKTYQGEEQIIAFWKLSMQGAEHYRFEQQQFYVSKKIAVFIGVYHYQGDGRLYGLTGKQIKFSIPAVTVLTIDQKEQRVTLHQDFLDYANLSPEVIK